MQLKSSIALRSISIFRKTHLLAIRANLEKVTTKRHCIKFGSVKFCEILFCKLVDTMYALLRAIDITANV